MRRKTCSWQREADMDAMLHISTLHYLVLGAALFLLGVIGVLTSRNVVIVSDVD